MLTLSIVTAAMLVVQEPRSTTPPAAVRAVPPATVVTTATVAPLVTASDHLDSARRAFVTGAFDIARREFVIAAALERDAGRVPVEASFGLAHALYSMSYNREAAIVMGVLAKEAASVGDVETEAKALVDAMWLNLDCGQRAQARVDGQRLRALATHPSLSAATRKAVKQRVG